MVAIVVATLAVASSARGGTDTGTLNVTATVNSSCALSGGTLAFGTYASGQSNNLDVTGSINYSNCAAGLLTFELDGGANGTVSARKMKSGSNFLSYQIYKTAGRSTVWGTGTDALQLQLLQAGSGKVDVYGRIPSGQVVAPGSYTDTVTITLTF